MTLPYAPNEASEEGQKRLAALGRFILRFANTESLLFTTLCVVAQVNPKVGQAIFSGSKADGAVQFIKRMFQVMNVPVALKASYEDLFEHFAQINSARNLILHYGISEVGDDFVATDRLKALTEDRVRSMTVSAELFDQMTADLEKINATLMLNLFANEADKEETSAKSNIGSVSQQTWLYKPQSVQTKKSEIPSGKATRKSEKAPKDRP